MSKNSQRPDPIVVETRGFLQKWRWPDTGVEAWALIEYQIDFPELPGDVRLTLILQATIPIHMQIATARRLFKNIGVHTAAEVMREAKETGKIELGVMRKFEADSLIQEAEAIGLRIEAKAVD